MNKKSKIFLAGGYGLVGSAVYRKLLEEGYKDILRPSFEELDLINLASVEEFFDKEKPQYVIDAAAKVGGIMANNTYPVDFLLDNLKIQNNLIETSHKHKVKKLLFLGSSCIYPKQAKQPIKEEYLLTGELEPTNEWYAIAKITGIKLCQAYRKQYKDKFISAMPTNLYGPGDNFHKDQSHVIPGLMRRFHEAKMNHSPAVVVWGTGSPKREFLFVEDLAEALVFLLEKYDGDEFVNVGTGSDVTIKQLVEIISEVVGYEGKIVWDKTKPDGTPRKLLDVSKINSLGWKAKTDLKEGLIRTYSWFVENVNTGTIRL
jgi:GDP-L-fucose synthase